MPAWKVISHRSAAHRDHMKRGSSHATRNVTRDRERPPVCRSGRVHRQQTITESADNLASIHGMRRIRPAHVRLTCRYHPCICAREGMSMHRIAACSVASASPRGDVSKGSAPPIRMWRWACGNGSCRSFARQRSELACWHEACVPAPATGTRYAVVASTHLKDGSSANRSLNMRSHFGAGSYHQHHALTVVGGSASCQLKIQKSKKVCRGRGGHVAGPRPLRTRPTGK